MSFYKIPLCLFLCFSSIPAKNTYIEKPESLMPSSLDIDLKTAPHKNQIPLYSYCAAAKINSLQNLKNQLIKSKNQWNKQYENLDNKGDAIESLLDSYRLKLSAELKKMQKNSGAVLDELKKESLADQYASLKADMDNLDKKKEHLLDQIHTANLKIETYEKEIESLSHIQKNLQIDFDRPSYFQKDAFFDSDHSIESNSSLPAFGGANTSSVRDLQACLAGAYDMDIEISKDFAFHVRGGVVSAGTWAYPGGGVHVGLDIAAGLYTPIVAVGNGIVLYANAPVDTNCGYVGNYVGYPGGGGNTICMLVNMESGLYAVSYFHMSTTQYVHAGQKVNKNDVIALSGNSGNSSGPHTHVEIFKLFVSYEEALSYFSATADFSWGCGWRDPGARSKYGMRIRPESVLL